MIAFTSSATLVSPAALDEDARLEATIDRAELEALLGANDPPQLWFELASERDEPQRVTLELTDADLRALLEGADGEELTLALDAQGVSALLEEPDVEAHGMRTGVAIAVALVAGAAAAPSALGATTQVSPAAQTQVAKTAVSSQQVSRQVVRSQVRSGRTSPVKFSQLSVLRAGAVR